MSEENLMTTPFLERKLLKYDSGKVVVDDCGRTTEILGKCILDMDIAQKCPKAAQLMLQIRNKTDDLHGKETIFTSTECESHFYNRPDDEIRCLCRRGLEMNFGRCPLGGNRTSFRRDWITTKQYPAMQELPVSVSISNPDQSDFSYSDPRKCGIDLEKAAA